MLTEILGKFKEGQTYSLQELSYMLKINIQSLKAQVEYLEKHGYIKKVEMNTDCSNKCSSCKGCSNNIQNLNIWELT